MFALIKLGGLQHIIKKGSIIKVNKLNVPCDEELTIKEVLAKGKDKDIEFGSPYLNNVTVTAKVLDHTKDSKVTIFKKKRRNNYRKKIGFRQSITKLEIVDIQ